MWMDIGADGWRLVFVSHEKLRGNVDFFKLEKGRLWKQLITTCIFLLDGDL